MLIWQPVQFCSRATQVLMRHENIFFWLASVLWWCITGVPTVYLLNYLPWNIGHNVVLELQCQTLFLQIVWLLQPPINKSHYILCPVPTRAVVVCPALFSAHVHSIVTSENWQTQSACETAVTYHDYYHHYYYYHCYHHHHRCQHCQKHYNTLGLHKSEFHTLTRKHHSQVKLPKFSDCRIIITGNTDTCWKPDI